MAVRPARSARRTVKDAGLSSMGLLGAVVFAAR